MQTIEVTLRLHMTAGHMLGIRAECHMWLANFAYTQMDFRWSDWWKANPGRPGHKDLSYKDILFTMTSLLGTCVVVPVH